MSNTPKKTSKKTASKKTAKKAAAKKPVAKKGGRDLRTADGRSAFDGEVLSAVASSTESAMSDLTDAVGGATPTQIRASLGRLIDAGQVTTYGKTRNTRYQIPGAGRLDASAA